MSFSEEEKNIILLYGEEKSLGNYSLDDEQNWQDLSSQMGRDWSEIRDAYRQWKLSDGDVASQERENETFEAANGSARQENNNNNEVLLERVVDVFAGDLSELRSNQAAVEVENIDNTDYQFADSMMQLLPVNVEYTDMDNIEYIYNDTETFANINFEDKAVATASKKRRNLDELDAELIETLIYQSEKELALKRKEHEKKMKIYAMHLEHGRELHQEKMEILRAKLRAIQEKVYHIDYAISNKQLHKRFKSGPI